MLEALRGLGYSTATAVADLIDNSIAAHATQVDITVSWRGTESFISIVDNGSGMNDEDLASAMRLGEKSPLDTRASSDLGRFGLGLKTASFSQCRRLTVASKKAGLIHCLRWDLDILKANNDDWHLLEGPAPGSEDIIRSLDTVETGTAVLWQVLDRIVTAGFKEQDLLDLMDRIENHLAMVFHEYLSGTCPILRLIINGRSVRPWDPFLTHHSATWTSPLLSLNTDCGIIEIVGYVLPHKDWLTESEYMTAGGTEGWTAQQGFYVYRNRRMLVAGSWLGLGHGRVWTKEQAYCLARIKLNLPNSADYDWKIDVRKSTARPPVALRTVLTRLGEDTRERARRVFAHRGHATVANTRQPVAQAWRAEHFASGVRYRIDENHAAVRAVLDQAGELESAIRAMMRVLEETIPVQRIWLDTAEGKESPRTAFEGGAVSEVRGILGVMYTNLVKKKGLSPELARQHLMHTEPFHNYPDLVASLTEAPNEDMR